MALDVNRREFLKIAAGAGAALTVPTPGVILSRKYSEMRLADLSGAGDAIRELKLTS